MRIVHINTVIGRGGAALSTQMLSDTQSAAGDQSTILATADYIDHPRTQLLDPSPDKALEGQTEQAGLQYYALQGSHRLVSHAAVVNADVVHCHNLHGNYFNPFSLIPLSHVRPVVWTLRDMHPITGHCINSLDCTRWAIGCGACPDLELPVALSVDSTATLWAHKRMIAGMSPLTIVCPSKWLQTKVEKSLLAEHPSYHIPNGTDTSVFSPRNARHAKQALGLAPEVPVVGTVAEGGFRNPWKGEDPLHRAIRALQERVPNVVVLSVGNEGAPPTALNLRTSVHLG
jgi:glycosyltransferase involved in cell wall biosynthesis